MFDFGILFPSVLNGLTTGAVYALVALGLTLIYGVLHIINFAHGASLMVALYAVWLLKDRLGVDPYLALVIVVPGMFVVGYALQRLVINRASHGKDENILLVTLGIAIVKSSSWVRSAPMNNGAACIAHSVRCSTCSSGVSRVGWRFGPHPTGPTTSMSVSFHRPCET